MNTILAIPLALAFLAEPTGEIVDRVAATVEGDVVTLSDLVERIGPEWSRIEAMPGGPGRDRERRDLLRRAFDVVVAEKLLSQQAKALQLEVSDAQVDAAIADIKTRNRLDDAAFAQALEDQGLDLPSFRTQVRRELETYSVLNQKVRGRVRISDADVRNYYQTHPQEFGGEEEVRVRHIFLPLREGAPKADEEKARAIGERALGRLAQGEDFAKVARDVSKGPSAGDGGELGWLRRGTIQEILEDAAFALKPGEVSGLVRAGPGLHLLKVEERRVGGGKSLEEVSEEIRIRLYEEQVGTYRQQYIEELKRGAAIDVRIPELQG